MAVYKGYSVEPFGGGKIQCLTCKTTPYVLDVPTATFYRCNMEGYSLFSYNHHQIIKCECGIGLIRKEDVIEDVIEDCKYGTGGIFGRFTVKPRALLNLNISETSYDEIQGRRYVESLEL